MSADDENPLNRWSRLKRTRAKGESVDEPPVEVARRGAAGPVAGRNLRGRRWTRVLLPMTMSAS